MNAKIKKRGTLRSLLLGSIVCVVTCVEATSKYQGINRGSKRIPSNRRLFSTVQKEENQMDNRKGSLEMRLLRQIKKNDSIGILYYIGQGANINALYGKDTLFDILLKRGNLGVLAVLKANGGKVLTREQIEDLKARYPELPASRVSPQDFRVLGGYKFGPGLGGPGLNREKILKEIEVHESNIRWATGELRRLVAEDKEDKKTAEKMLEDSHRNTREATDAIKRINIILDTHEEDNRDHLKSHGRILWSKENVEELKSLKASFEDKLRRLAEEQIALGKTIAGLESNIRGCDGFV